MDDRLNALLARFLEEGDENAIEELVRRTRPPLLRAARRIVREADTEDVVQTAYHSLLRRREAPRHARLMAWLMTAVVRIAYRHHAKRRRQHELARKLASEAPRGGGESDEIAALRSEIDRLPSGYRDAIVLHYLEGLTAAETGALLGLTDGAVRQRLHRARALLRSRLSPRFKYGLMFLPWWCADRAAAGALLLGGTMKAKTAAVGALALVLLLSGSLVWRANRAPAPVDRVARTENGPASAAPDETGGEGELEVTSADKARLPFASGTVVDKTLAPLSGVHVVARGMEDSGSDRQPAWIVTGDAAGRALTVTGADGAFAIRDPVPGLYSLVFVRDGQECTQRQGLSDDPANNQNLRIVLEPGRRYGGIVTDTNGAPIASAKIAAWRGKAPNGVEQLAYADDEGRFEFRSLSPPHAMFMVAATGYKEHVGQSDGEHVRITLSRNAVLVDVVDAENARPVDKPSGLVLREQGKVFVTNSLYTDWIETFRPVPGRLVFPVSFMTVVDRTGALNGELHVLAREYRAHRETLRVEKGKEPPHLTVVLRRGAEPPAITGAVRGPAAAKVQLRTPAPENFIVGSDDRLGLLFLAETRDGSFSFPAVAGVTYRLLVEAPGYARRAIDVTAPARALTVTLAAAGTLAVTVTEPDGKPVKDRWVHVEPEGEKRRHWHARTDADGVARFADLPPGRMHLVPFRYDAGLGWGSVSADVTARVETAVALPLPRRVPFTVRVSEPRAGVVLRVEPESGFAMHGGEWQRLRGLHSVTDETGTCVVKLYPGPYRLSVIVGRSKHKSRFTVPESEDGVHTLELPSGGASVFGRVVESGSGHPVVGRPVYAAAKGGHGWSGSSVTDEEGRYEIAGLPAGEVTIHMMGSAHRQGYLDRGSPYPRAQRTATIGAVGRHQLNFAVPRISGENAVPRTVRLTVRVLDAETGEPLPGATAHATGLIDGTWVGCGSVAAKGEDGRGEGMLIAAESYRIRVYARSGRMTDYEPAKLDRTGDTIDVDVALKRRAPTK